MTSLPPVSTTGPDAGGATPVPDEAEVREAPAAADASGAAHAPDEPDGAGEPGRPTGGEPPPVHRRRRALFAAVGAAAVVVVLAAVVYRAWDTRVEADLTEATETLQLVVLELHDAVEAGGLALDSSAGRVGDDQVRVELAAVVSGVDEVSWSIPDGSRQARTVAAKGLAEQARTHVAAVESATELVLVAVDAFELDQAVHLEGQANARLAVSIADGRATLDATAGQVLDDAVRVTLSDALASAEALEPTLVDETLSDVEQTQLRAASAAALAQHADVLDATRQAVVDAQAAWQAEQERVAAEQAAQAAQAAEDARRAQEQATIRPRTSGPSSGTSTPEQVRPKTSGGTKAPATGGTSSGSSPSAPVPVPAPESAYETETETGTWCGAGDTSGAEGSGGWC